MSEVDGKVDVSVLMITSRGGKGLVFPKVRSAQDHNSSAIRQICCVFCLPPYQQPFMQGKMRREAGKLMRLWRQLLLVRL